SSRNIPSFYSMVEDPNHFLAKLNGHSELTHFNDEILSYVKNQQIRLKVIKAANYYYLLLLRKDMEKVKSYPLLEDMVQDNVFKKLSIISSDVDSILPVCRETVESLKMCQMDVVKERRKNIIS